MKLLLALSAALLVAAAPKSQGIDPLNDDVLPPDESSAATPGWEKRFEAFNLEADTVARAAGFRGQIGMSNASGGVSVQFDTEHKMSLKRPPDLWRWASVTKQVIAVLVMQEVAKGNVVLDAPLSRYLPNFRSLNAGSMNVRQLLRHQSGLPNTEDTAASPQKTPAYNSLRYAGSRDPLTGYCAGKPKAPPGGSWEYNNCDYIVAGALLKAITGKSWRKLVAERIAEPLGLKTLGFFPSKKPSRAGFVDGRPEPPIDLASFDAAGAIYGSVSDLIRFDRALLDGALLPPSALAEMWDGKPDLGYIALGQWVFEASLKGCAKPTRIVERRGAIGGVQVRNFIMPELRTVVVAFTDKGEFEFGEIWQGSGFSHDLLSLAACGKPPQ